MQIPSLLVVLPGGCVETIMYHFNLASVSVLSMFALVLVQLSRAENNDAPCICVPPHMCRDSDSVANGEGFLDVRLQAGVNGCKSYFEICCEQPQVVLQLDKVSPAMKGCGYEHAMAMDFRITGDGIHARFGETPWSIVVLLHTGEKNMYKCGGSLIHPQVVVTAAHCVAGMLDATWTIRAGEWNTRSQDEAHPHQDRRVKEIVVHPLYQATSLRNDIALLFIAEAVSLAPNVNLVCIPSPNIQLDDAVRCIASGWGKNAFRMGKHSSILKKVELPIVPRDACVQALRSTRLGKFYHLDASFICAGGERNKDTCKGDGGSPLVCPVVGDVGRWMQVGIVSWGIGCGETNTPGVYANVPLYRDWLDKQLEAKGLDASSYKYE